MPFWSLASAFVIVSRINHAIFRDRRWLTRPRMTESMLADLQITWGLVRSNLFFYPWGLISVTIPLYTLNYDELTAHAGTSTALHSARSVQLNIYTRKKTLCMSNHTLTCLKMTIVNSFFRGATFKPGLTWSDCCCSVIFKGVNGTFLVDIYKKNLSKAVEMCRVAMITFSVEHKYSSLCVMCNFASQNI